jgi:hypothetical protein
VEHGLAPALWAALRPGRSLPADVATTLRQAHRSNTGRSILLRHQLEEVVHALAQGGVEVLLLKGAAYLAGDVFADVGIREMSDLDLVIKPEDLDAARSAMTAAGYSFVPHPFGLEHHDRAFTAPAAVALVELHVAIGSPEVDAALPSEEVWRRSRRIEIGTAVARVPSHEDALLHNVLHAQVQDHEHAFLGVPLRQLHTFVLLARAWGTEVDWPTVARRAHAAGFGPQWVGHVHLAGRIFGTDGLPGVDARPVTRAHTAACLLSFALGWPTDVARNLSYALDREYLDVRYGPIRSGPRLVAVRARHLAALLRRRRGAVMAEVTSRRR